LRVVKFGIGARTKEISIMQKPYHAFQPERPAKEVVRALSGVLFSLLLLASALVALVVVPAQSDRVELSESDLSGLYLSSVRGRLLATGTGDTRSEVLSGEDLKHGSAYSCDGNSLALLRSTRKKTAIFLSPGSTMKINQPGERADLLLTEGTVSARVFVDYDGGSLTFGLRNWNVTPRSGSFVRLTVGEPGLRVEVHQGEASLERRGELRQLQPGSETVITEDRVDTKPGRYLTVPEVLGPSPGTLVAGGKRVEFSWSKVPGADSYRLEMSKDILFQETLGPRSAGRTSLSLAVEGDGKYYWRVRAIGRGGMAFEPSWPQLILVRTEPVPKEEIPPPPELLLLRPPETQRNVIIVRGKTDPTAVVLIRLEAEGRTILETRPGEVSANADGVFQHHMRVNRTGLIKVVISAYYRPERKNTLSSEVRVDF
jgi:hypothetical protein